jgi:hypothetical protein
MCYVDDIQSWATNEITVNWNSVLSWVASFVADQGPGGAEVLPGIVTMTPERILEEEGVAPSQVTCWSVAGANGVPEDATGVVVNVTAVGPHGPGYAVVYPDTLGNGATPIPGTSTVNFQVDEAVANQTFVRLGPNGDLCYATQGAALIRLLVDVSGYVTADSGVVLGTPRRLLDTRQPGIGEISGALAPRQATSIQVTGELGVPDDAESVIVNVTVDDARAPGNLRVYPGGPVPNASTVNYVAGWAKANTAVVTLSEEGRISLFSDSTAPAHVIVDVLGYTMPGSSHVGTIPTRVLDTRDLGERVEPRTIYTVPVRGDVVPVDATAVVLNVTAIHPTAPGNLRVYPGDVGEGEPPNASSLNYVPGSDTANLVVVDLPVDGQIALYSDQHTGSVDVAIDVLGYIVR